MLSQSLTAQALFALKIRRTRTQIAIPRERLLGEGVLCTQADKCSLVRSVLINGMCDFEDEVKTTVRELAERTFDEHSFKVFLYNYSTFSKTEHEPQGGDPLLKRRCGGSNKRSLLLSTALVLAITNRASPLCSQNKTDKNSNRNFVRVLAWWVRTLCASGQI